MWNDVLKMKDPVDMEYKRLEELFCQKDNTVPEKEKSPIRTAVSSEVSNRNLPLIECYFILEYIIDNLWFSFLSFFVARLL